MQSFITVPDHSCKYLISGVTSVSHERAREMTSIDWLHSVFSFFFSFCQDRCRQAREAASVFKSKGEPGRDSRLHCLPPRSCFRKRVSRRLAGGLPTLSSSQDAVSALPAGRSRLPGLLNMRSDPSTSGTNHRGRAHLPGQGCRG